MGGGSGASLRFRAICRPVVAAATGALLANVTLGQHFLQPPPVLCADAALLQPHTAPGSETQQQEVEASSAPVPSWFSSLIMSVRVVFRGAFLVIIWLPTALAWVIARDERRRAKLILWALEHSGPVFVKLGQWASTRPDLFSDVLCEVLSTLQTNVAPHPLAYSQAQLVRAFGPLADRVQLGPLVGSGSMAQVYRGTLNQPDGARVDVAIKILHPRIHARVELDLALMRFGASVLSLLPKAEWLALYETVSQFSRVMRSQLDLDREARSLDRFRRNFARQPQICFPAPLWPLVHQDVLVETFEPGVPLGEFLLAGARARNGGNNGGNNSGNMNGNVNGDAALRREMGRLGISATLKMMIEDNFIHADLHPGNMLVRSAEMAQQLAIARAHAQPQARLQGEGQAQAGAEARKAEDMSASTRSPISAWSAFWARVFPSDADLAASASGSGSGCEPAAASSKPQLVLLDAGLVEELSPRNRENFLALYGALVQGDGRLAADLMMYKAPHRDPTDPDPELTAKAERAARLCRDVEGFREEMQDIVANIPDMTAASFAIGPLLRRVMRLARTHHVRIDPSFASLVVALGVVEGVGRQLDPQLSIVRASVPVLLANKEARTLLLRMDPRVWASLL